MSGRWPPAKSAGQSPSASATSVPSVPPRPSSSPYSSNTSPAPAPSPTITPVQPGGTGKALALVYSLVARGNVVLADNSATQYGNFVPISRKILDKIVQGLQNPPKGDRMSYQYDRFGFHILVEPISAMNVPTFPLIFLCMADESFPRRNVFAFLEDITNRFKSMYTADVVSRAVAFQMNKDYQPILQRQMDFFCNDPGLNKIAGVRKQIDETREVMIQNIDKLLERGDKIDLLVDKTDGLQQTSVQFKKESKKLQWAMFMKNIKLIVALVILTVIVFIFALLMTCGVTLSCLKF